MSIEKGQNADWIRFERDKSADEIEVIKNATSKAGAVLAEYGYEQKLITMDEVSILTQEGFSFLGKEDAGGAYKPEFNKIFLNEERTDSKLRLAMSVIHEYSHKIMHPVDEAGLDVVQKFSLLNEAIISIIERKTFLRLKNDELFQGEISETQLLKKKYPVAIKTEMQKYGYEERDVFLIRKHSLPDSADKFTLELRRFSYLKEYKIMLKLLNKIIEMGRVNRDVIERDFIEGIPFGNVDNIKEKVDEIFGEGKFSTLEKACELGNPEGVEKVIESL